MFIFIGIAIIVRNMDYGIDLSALFYLGIFAAVGWLFWKWSINFDKPRFFYSSVADFSFTGLRSKLAPLTDLLPLLTLVFFSLAFIDPHYYTERKKDNTSLNSENNIPAEGLAIYLVLDQSGSMAEEVSIQRKVWKKTDLVKQVTHDFVFGNQQKGLKGRPNDMIGLVYFARGAQVIAPLTLDHAAILDQLKKFDNVKLETQDGTSIGYALYKTVDLISATRHYAQEISGQGKPAYEIKDGVIILVTDGLQSPSPLDAGKRLRNIDLQEAGEFAKQNNVKLYIINVEPRIAGKEFGPQRRLMERVTALTGGKFYNVDESTGLDDIYSEIDRIEKSIIPLDLISKKLLPNIYERVSFYRILLVLGILSLLFSILLEGTLLRRTP
jgi:Ca-activated chloride channel family protein